MITLTPRSTLTDTLVPYTTLFRSFSGHFGRITDSISEPIVASCRAEAVPVELKQSLLPGFGFRRVIVRQEIDQFAHAAGPVAADHQLFVGVFHDAGITDREAFGLERQNVGDHAIGVDSKRQAIVACSTWTLLFFCIWFLDRKSTRLNSSH